MTYLVILWWEIESFTPPPPPTIYIQNKLVCVREIERDKERGPTGSINLTESTLHKILKWIILSAEREETEIEICQILVATKNSPLSMRHESRAQISDIFWKQITLEFFLVDLWIWILLPLKTSKVLYLQVANSLSLSLFLSYAKRNWHERDEIFNIYSLMSIRRNRWVENVISGSHRKEVPPNPLPTFLTSRRDLNELNIWRKKLG